jgi:hypothetical protein
MCEGGLLINWIIGLALKLASLFTPWPVEIMGSIDRLLLFFMLYHEKISTKNQPNPKKSRTGPFISFPDR